MRVSRRFIFYVILQSSTGMDMQELLCPAKIRSMEKLTVTLHIRVSEETAAALKRLADADRRKLAPYIGLVLDKHVAEHAAAEKTKAAKK